MTGIKSIIKQNEGNIEKLPHIVSNFQHQSLENLDFLLPSYQTNFFKSGKTYSNEKESRDDAINQIILQEIKELRTENKYGFESLEEANLKITKLQEELKENTQTIRDLLLARKNAKRIYFLGLFTGITTGIGGAVFNNFIYIIVGAGIVLTAITGLWEAKQNEW